MEKEIIELYKKGFKIKEIAIKYNCERHKISRILKKNNISTSRHELLKGKKYTNSCGDTYIVLHDRVNNGHGECFIKFEKTGYSKWVLSSLVKKGHIKDYYKKTIYGVACKGKIICRNNTIEKLCFHRWLSMVSRCYNKKDIGYKFYGAKGVIICDKWLIFENFYKDLKKIKGYDEEKYIKHEIELDKDKFGFNKIYDINNCQFITINENRKYEMKNIKPFKAISPTGEIFIYETQSDCARNLNMVARSISKCLHKQLKHHHGYSFEYLEPQTTIPDGSSE